jgi:NADH dehydrogenase
MPTRIIILGGGFAGVYTARHLQHLLRRRADIEIALISRNNYFTMTPLLFEAGSGLLEPRHSVQPIRPLLGKAKFIEAEIHGIDLDRRIISTQLVHREPFEIHYDQLILALGGITNTRIIPGAEHAATFKTLADAIWLRNHVIQAFEQADVERDADRRRALLTFIIVGGGFIGVELMGELTEFLKNLARAYDNVRFEDLRFELIEAMGRIAPEFDDDLADSAARTLQQRGVNIRVNTKVASVDAGTIHLPGGESIAAQTIILATGVVPSPVVAALPLDKQRNGRINVEPTMRVKDHPELWALGDCAAIPDPTAKPYPPLAQHALREAKTLARNVAAALDHRPLKPFIYSSKGTLAALGHYRGVGRIGRIRIKGFLAWWVWRTYYLMQMPQWQRRLRIMIDWTVGLIFKHDIVQLDLQREGERGQGPAQ